VSGSRGGPAPPSLSWRDGWLWQALPVASPNFAARPPGTTVDLAVIHSISLPPGEYGGDAVERLFTNRLDGNAHPFFASLRGLRVSAHFFLRRDGSLLQFVSCDDQAWHAGRSDWRGRGDCNPYSIGIELEGLEGEAFEKAQYERLQQLIVELSERYPLTGVTGHEHIAPGRKQDPGSAFDWHGLQRALALLRLEFAF
jgi:AmpD protein